MNVVIYKIYLLRDSAAGVYLFEAPSLLLPPPPYTLFILYVYTLYLFTQGRGGGVVELTREKVRGATVHKAPSKTPTWLTVSSVNFLDGGILVWCLYG